MDSNTETLIRELAAKLGTTVEHLYTVLVKQAFITGVSDIVICSFILVALIFSAFYLFKGIAKAKKNQDEREPYAIPEFIIPVILAVIFGIMFIIAFLANIEDIITCFSNPEYFAVHEILKYVR
jgi:hypothetical protein